MRIAVVGLGRIGSQILRELDRRFPEVMGMDIDPRRVEEMRREGLKATLDALEIAEADVYLIAVSTGPRMERLMAAAEALKPAPAGLVSVESTVIPGTMARLADSFANRGLLAGQDFFLVHTPHRILFGEEGSIFGQPRVIGGLTPACLERGVDFYRQLVPSLTPCHDIRLAELTKIVENSLRHVEISCAEALALYCQEAGLDYDELRAMVGTKGNVRLLRAQYGIGGECLPKDISFLFETTGCKLFEDAIKIDSEYRNWLFCEARAPRVLVRGLTFKPGWRDLEYSRAVELVERLRAAGCEVWVEDPLYNAEELADLGYQPWSPDREADTVVEWGKVSKGGSNHG